MTHRLEARFNAAAMWLIVSPFVPIIAVAHHGSNANPDLYLAENLLELEGQITEVFWRNPHPRLRLTVVDDDQESTVWELEMALSLYAFGRRGITADFVQVGDPVKAAGVVSRRDPHSIGLLHLLLPNGQELVSRNRENRWSDVRVATTTQAFDPGRVRAAEEAAEGIFRVWGRPVGPPRPRASDYADLLTEHGRNLATAFNPVTDWPELDCRIGSPTQMFGPTPMEVTDGGDRIHIRTQEYDVRRVIYLGDAVGRSEPVSSNVGYSVGRWEGETLVVSTSHIDWPYFDADGTPQSDQMSYTERFTVSDDGSQLNYSIVAIDPIVFTAPVELERAWLWEPGIELMPYDCVAQWDDTSVLDE